MNESIGHIAEVEEWCSPQEELRRAFLLAAGYFRMMAYKGIEVEMQQLVLHLNGCTPILTYEQRKQLQHEVEKAQMIERDLTELAKEEFLFASEVFADFAAHYQPRRSAPNASGEAR